MVKKQILNNFGMIKLKQTKFCMISPRIEVKMIILQQNN
jgi:hypothetical protein